ncbi:MAG TPA: AmmeMemoRadiSam system protein B, partial [Thermodesulfobacteriota bacterium]|nr:AmmeMemoRadiSam system protein B [Thermodesulfobacteriota bacterium]
LFVVSGFSGEQIKIRPSPLAGSWYPADPQELKALVKKYLDYTQSPEIREKIAALISPHAGYQFSGQAAACGFATLRGKDFDRVIIIGPSHRAWFRGICVSSFDFYETPLGRVPVAKKVSEELSSQKLFLFDPEAEGQEHSLEMQIPFLQVVLKNFTIIPLMVGELGENDFVEAAKFLKPYVTDKTLVVVSSDFTHYGERFGYLPFTEDIKNNLKKLDLGAVDMILKKDFTGYQKYLQRTGATICGRNGIGILLPLLPSDAQGALLAYYTSGDVLNDYSSTVSYVSIVFKKPAL